MTATDRSSDLTAETVARKTWVTPVVIVESTSSETLSNFNTLGPDAAVSGISYGS